MRIRGRIVAVGLSGLCLLGAAACSGDSGSPSPTQQAELTPAQRLAAAKSTVDAATSLHLTLTSSNVPDDASGIVSAEGVGTHPPAFQGTFNVKIRGVQADAEVTAVGGDVWAKLPFVPGTNKIDPAQFGLPDPAGLFSPDTGLTTLLTATTDLKAGGQTRKGAEVLTTITGTLPGSAVVDLFRIGDRTGSYATTYGLTDTNELRQVELTGPFFGARSESTYNLTLDQYDQPVTISPPT